MVLYQGDWCDVSWIQVNFLQYDKRIFKGRWNEAML